MSETSERTALADRAKEILENQVFNRAMERLAEQYMLVCVDGPTVEIREEARMYLKVVKAIPDHFRAIILDGALAQDTLDRWGQP